jgi:FkbM family methyltransferase
VKSLFKRLLDNAGLEVRRTRATSKGFTSDPYLALKKMLTAMGRQQPVIFDVGAHKGETVARFRELFPAADIWCFEAFPDSASQLEQRFSADPAVHVTAAAVSDRAGSRTFYANANDSTNSLLPRNDASRRYYHSSASASETLSVDCITIDEHVQENKIDHIDILKFDIQGGELMAFEGARETLQNHRASLIYTEALFVPHYEGNPLFNDLWNHLAGYGYTLFDMYDLYRAGNGQLRFADALFVSPQVRQNVIDAFPEEP